MEMRVILIAIEMPTNYQALQLRIALQYTFDKYFYFSA